MNDWWVAAAAAKHPNDVRLSVHNTQITLVHVKGWTGGGIKRDDSQKRRASKRGDRRLVAAFIGPTLDHVSCPVALSVSLYISSASADCDAQVKGRWFKAPLWRVLKAADWPSSPPRDAGPVKKKNEMYKFPVWFMLMSVTAAYSYLFDAGHDDLAETSTRKRKREKDE
ncbi:hypothetical protein OUZ56_024926 [Daphnia magna]|uniref:Uncharacterized protein n=1 Tax=Daphnia magna TaxID=35525 RepID=A0ABQ9ZIE0_9CRUS|nr:hypothetical protein OUZ56_024926 [Daphnia magna]